MNRRRFGALAMAGALSLPAVTARAQRRRSNNLLISETTAAEIDISQTSLTLHSQRSTETDDFTFEVIQLRNDLGTVWLQFIAGPGRFGYAVAYDRLRRLFEGEHGEANVDDIGSVTLDDGGWMAFRLGAGMSSYSEVQHDAFADTHLWVEVQATDTNMETIIDEIQLIDLAGMPPFLFLEESEALDGLFKRSASPINTNRLAIPDRSTGERSTSPVNTAAGSDDEVIEAVREHQAQFHDEKARFDEAIQTMADDNPVGQAEMELYTVIVEVMFSWTVYPTTASDLVFAESLSTLESTYREWADAVGEMGVTLGAWSTGGGPVDDFIAATDAALQVDRRLSAELRSIGVFPGSRISASSLDVMIRVAVPDELVALAS